MFVCVKVVEPNLQLLPIEPHHDPSDIVPVNKPLLYLLKLFLLYGKGQNVRGVIMKLL